MHAAVPYARRAPVVALLQRYRRFASVGRHACVQQHEGHQCASAIPQGGGLPRALLVEVFCLEPAEPADYAANFAATGRDGCSWLCFVGNSKRWKEGLLSADIEVGGARVTLTAERVGRSGNTSTVRFRWLGGDDGLAFSEIISAAGELPIPPYLNRATEESDNSDYQTVFSHVDGSVAAPTAGLHFTPAVLDSLDRAGVARRELTLHVGAGTFQPVKTDDIGSHEDAQRIYFGEPRSYRGACRP